VRYRSELDNIATPAGVFARCAGIFRIATSFQRREFFRLARRPGLSFCRNRQYYPLTITDFASRDPIAHGALSRTREQYALLIDPGKQ